MIAPLRQIDPEVSEKRRRMGHAYRAIASAFLPEPPGTTDNPPPVPRWRAWLFAGWVAIVTAVYVAMMVRS